MIIPIGGQPRSVMSDDFDGQPTAGAAALLCPHYRRLPRATVFSRFCGPCRTARHLDFAVRPKTSFSHDGPRLITRLLFQGEISTKVVALRGAGPEETVASLPRVDGRILAGS